MKNTSINRYNVAVVDQSGKVGTVRYFQKGGRTYVRSASNRVDSNSNPRTDGQMKTRLLYSSRNAMYRLLKGLLKGAFQFKPRHLSEYQAYMQANAGIGAYMTKAEYRSGKIVLLPVKVAEGELAEIEVTPAPDNSSFELNIIVGSPTVAATNIGTLSAQLIENNDFLKAGEQLTFIFGKANAPAQYAVIVLDPESTEAIPESLHFTALVDNLGLQDSVNDFMAVIHSNSDGLTSNAVIALKPSAQSEYTTYTSAAKFEAARDSYGKAKESILIPAKEA